MNKVFHIVLLFPSKDLNGGLKVSNHLQSKLVMVEATPFPGTLVLQDVV